MLRKKFSLQTVLEYRKILEDKARQRHAQAVAKVQDAELQVLKAEQALEKLCRSMEERCTGGLSVQDLLWCEDGIQRQRELVTRLRARLDALDRAVEKRRDELVQAAREAKLLENLKDKHEERCREALRCEEKVVIDEIAAQYARSR